MQDTPNSPHDRPRGRAGLAVMACVAACSFLAGVCAHSSFLRGRTRPDAEAQLPPRLKTLPGWRGWPHEGQETGPIRCRLTALPGGKGTRDQKLRLELVNVSDQPVRLRAATWLDYQVTYLVREGKYTRGTFTPAVLSSTAREADSAGQPAGNLPVMTLAPGEAYTTETNLWVIQAHCYGVSPGRYQLEAVFTYQDLAGHPSRGQRMFSRSVPIDLEIPPWRLGKE